VNEATLNLVATSLGLSSTHRDNFDALKGKVEVELQGSWRAVSSTWRDVSRLHQARNLSQHHQVGSDGSELAGWRVATEKFSNSLIEVTFGKSLFAVRLADCIADSKLRELIKDAEELIAEGRYPQAAEQIFDGSSGNGVRLRA